MPSWKSFYGSRFLSAKALGEDTVKGKIVDVGPETMMQQNGTEKSQLALTLEGEDKLIPLNYTNAEILALAWGDDYAKWRGKSVLVSTHPVKLGNKEVDGLLVKPFGKK